MGSTAHLGVRAHTFAGSLVLVALLVAVAVSKVAEGYLAATP